MKPVRINIAEGITFDAITTDRFKTAQVSVNFLCPLTAETAALNAILPPVLLRGTANENTMADVSRRLQELYSASIVQTNYKRGDVQVFGLCANFIDSAFALDDTDITGGTLAMLRDLLFDPYTENGVFSVSYLEGEKQNLKDKINSTINNKTTYAVKRCREEMLRGENGSGTEYGTLEAVDAITPEALYSHYKKIISDSEISIFYVGPQSAEDMLPMISDIVKSLAPRKANRLTTVTKDRADKVKEVVDYEPVAQAKLSVGFRTAQYMKDADYYKFAAFCELYGGCTTSKLFMNVREKLSLCYYCQTVPDAHKGLMIVASGVEADKCEEARAEILAQLEDIKAGNITDDEFNGTIQSISSELRRMYDSPDALESFYVSRLLIGRNESPEEAAAMLEKVTKEDIAESAKKVTLDTVYMLLPDGKENCDEQA